MNNRDLLMRIDALNRRYEQSIARADDLKGTRESLPFLDRAVQCQMELAKLTDGASRELHRKECDRLMRMMEEIIGPDKLAAANTEQQERKTEPRGSASKNAGIAPNDPVETVPGMEGFDPEQFRWGSDKCPKTIPKQKLEDLAKEVPAAETILRNLDNVLYLAAHPERKERYDKVKGNNMLLYGPPGCGKSFLLGAVANYVVNKSTDAVFYYVQAPKLLTSLKNVAMKKLALTFEAAEKHALSIIVIEEIEFLTQRRDKEHVENEDILNTMLQLTSTPDGRSGVMLIGDTNKPWEIDTAMRSRFEGRMILMDLPTEERIREMLHRNLKPYVEAESEAFERSVNMLTEVLKGGSYRDLDGLYAKVQQLCLDKERIEEENDPDYEAKLTTADLEKLAAETHPEKSDADLARLRDIKLW